MLRINFIGAGHWGPNLVRNFYSNSDCTVGTIADKDPSRLALIGERFPGVEVTEDVDSVITDEKADAIVIATPFGTHYRLVKSALEAGKHVLVEKPLCRTLAECDELMAIAEENGLVLAVGHVFLFNAAVRKLKDIIDSGELGDVLYVSATRTNLGPYRTDASALWDLSSHDFSIFDYWFGESPRRVVAHGAGYLDPDVADVVFGTLIYNSGMIANFHASWLNPKKVREIIVVGTRKMATFDDLNLLEPVRVYDKAMSLDRSEISGSHSEFIAQTRDGDVLIPKVAGKEPLAFECSHFIECVQNGSTPLNNAEQAGRIVQQLMQAETAIRHGSPYRLQRPAQRGAFRDLVGDRDRSTIN